MGERADEYGDSPSARGEVRNLCFKVIDKLWRTAAMIEPEVQNQALWLIFHGRLECAFERAQRVGAGRGGPFNLRVKGLSLCKPDNTPRCLEVLNVSRKIVWRDGVCPECWIAGKSAG